MNGFLAGLTMLDWRQAVMLCVGFVLIYLAIKKNYEPALLLPIGFGTILANIPVSAAIGEQGPLTILFNVGISTELFPLLIFIAVGAMIDFTPLLTNPYMLLFGAAAQFGIFATIALATLCGFPLREAASIGIIGAADGPTSIYVANKFAQNLLGPISVAAYSYMALVPIIQPPVVKLLTTQQERKIHMDYHSGSVSKTVKIVFPIAVTCLAGIVAPASVALIGFLMFGNLIRECGVLESISQTAQKELANLVTILLGLSIASTMTGQNFVRLQTLIIILLGLAAFIFDTAGGVIFAKFLNLFRKEKINPMIGACGISAFPMSARVIHQMGQKEDPFNFLLMPAVSANVGGQIASVIAGGLILSLVH
ncbi:MAG TPA: sodium ion-translocating decarboxylase subunit beta [Candidatus Cloacimonadota bacterium]|nr:sodium ion-translocating decarboxylase subunit beta [Candidatus Cloacimonadota bacterium]HQL14198.1 sodium ion-translocating decarboxylase subunit beta [Candidatus Cloacimonadota bacterium]